MRIAARVFATLLLGLASPVFAGELVPIVGSSVWFEPPEGFVEIPAGGEKVGWMSQGTGAVISAQDMYSAMPPDFQAFQDDPALAQQRAAEMFANAVGDVVNTGDRKFIVMGGEMSAGGQDLSMWMAAAVPESAVSLLFAQPNLPGIEPVMDFDKVKAILANAKIYQPQIAADGVYSSGLFVPMQPPFLYPELTRGMIDISAVQDRTGNARAPRMGLIMLPSGSPGPSLDAMGAKWLGVETGAKLNSSESSTLVGYPALRQEWSGVRGEQSMTTIGYVAFLGAQAVVFHATAKTEEMTDEMIATIDAVAASISKKHPD